MAGEKIAMGKLNKFFKDNTLLAQAFETRNKSVADYLKGIDADMKSHPIQTRSIGLIFLYNIEKRNFGFAFFMCYFAGPVKGYTNLKGQRHHIRTNKNIIIK